MKKKRYKTMIVDDEPFVREDLKHLLGRYERVEVEWETSTLEEAVKILSENHLDLVFLDISLRGGNGFDLLPFTRPEKTMVVFVTAHEKYLKKASKSSAVGVLLKPVDNNDLNQLMEQVSNITH